MRSKQRLAIGVLATGSSATHTYLYVSADDQLFNAVHPLYMVIRLAIFAKNADKPFVKRILSAEAPCCICLLMSTRCLVFFSTPWHHKTLIVRLIVEHVWLPASSFCYFVSSCALYIYMQREHLLKLNVILLFKCVERAFEWPLVAR